MPQPNSLLISSCGGVSNAFSKFNMNVWTCPLLSKMLIQAFITVVNWVSQLYLFLNAYWLVYLREVSIHPDEPRYLSTLFVWATCRESERRDESYMWEPCHPFYRWEIHLQETVLWRFHLCQLVKRLFSRKGWTKTGPNSVASSFRTLGWGSSGPKALEGFKPPFETTLSPTKGSNLMRITCIEILAEFAVTSFHYCSNGIQHDIRIIYWWSSEWQSFTRTCGQHTCDLFLGSNREICNFCKGDWGLKKGDFFVANKYLILVSKIVICSTVDHRKILFASIWLTRGKWNVSVSF